MRSHNILPFAAVVKDEHENWKSRYVYKVRSVIRFLRWKCSSGGNSQADCWGVRLGSNECRKHEEMVSVFQKRQDKCAWRGIKCATVSGHERFEIKIENRSSEKQAIHNFRTTRIFSRRVSISDPRNCCGMFAKLRATFCDEGIEKLVPRYKKYLNLHCDYIDKYLNVAFFIFEFPCITSL